MAVNFCIPNHIELNSSTSRNQPPSSPLQFEIKFKFSRRCNFEKRVRTGDNSWETERLRTVDTPPGDYLVLNLKEFLVHNRARQLMLETLSTWERVDENHDDWVRIWINTALKRGRVAVRLMPASHNSVCIHVWVRNIFVIVETVETRIDRCLKKRKRTEEISTDSTCSICLESYSDGNEGVSMPCGHVFHDHCVRNWLRISLRCPYCRFDIKDS